MHNTGFCFFHSKIRPNDSSDVHKFVPVTNLTNHKGFSRAGNAGNPELCTSCSMLALCDVPHTFQHRESIRIPMFAKLSKVPGTALRPVFFNFDHSPCWTKRNKVSESPREKEEIHNVVQPIIMFIVCSMIRFYSSLSSVLVALIIIFCIFFLVVIVMTPSFFDDD